jgi:excisionase family DNA binding protein
MNTPPAMTAASPAHRLPLLDSDEIAKVLGVTPRRHIRRLVAERRIPFVKVGRFVRFEPGELDVGSTSRESTSSVGVRGCPEPAANLHVARWPGAFATWCRLRRRSPLDWDDFDRRGLSDER